MCQCTHCPGIFHHNVHHLRIRHHEIALHEPFHRELHVSYTVHLCQLVVNLRLANKIQMFLDQQTLITRITYLWKFSNIFRLRN